MRAIASKQSATFHQANTGEIVKEVITIPANSWRVHDAFILDFSGFYQGTPLTTAQFRVRLVGNDGAGPPNIIVAEFTHSPGANFTNVIRGSVMIGREGTDNIRSTYQIIPGNALAPAVNAAINTGFTSSFAQRLVIQLNIAITATTPFIEYSQFLCYKVRA